MQTSLHQAVLPGNYNEKHAMMINNEKHAMINMQTSRRHVSLVSPGNRHHVLQQSVHAQSIARELAFTRKLSLSKP